MSDNPMHRCNAAPRCRAKSKRTGLPAVRLQCEVIAFVGCTVPAVARRRGKRTAIFGMVVGEERHQRIALR
jgi:hypothetical protein